MDIRYRLRRVVREGCNNLNGASLWMSMSREGDAYRRIEDGESGLVWKFW